MADGRALAEHVMRAHHAFVLAVARRYAGADHADDVASRVYEKLLHGRLPDPDRPLLPWLRQVVRNQAIDHVRGIRHHEELDPARDHATVIDLADDVVDRVVVGDALSRLSSVERAAVVAEMVGLTPAEVGAKHGRSAHAVHSLAWRARKQLRALLEPAMLPLGAGLAWLRRVLQRGNQPTVQVAVDAVIIVAFALGVGIHAASPPVAEDARTSASSTVGTPTRTSKPVRAADAAPTVPQDPTDRAGRGSTEPPPRDARVEIEHRPGAAVPRRIYIVQPEVDTPIGRTSGETTFECSTPGWQRLPRTALVYQTCGQSGNETSAPTSTK